MFKNYSFPEKYQEKIDKALHSLGYSLTEPKRLAECIVKLSDFYQQKQKITPWDLKETQAAYFAYFFPLNYIRNLKVFDEVKNLGLFPNIKNFLDFGFGLGSGYLAARDTGVLLDHVPVQAVDSSNTALALFQKYLMEPGSPIEFHQHVHSTDAVDFAVLSYSLNELPTSAHWLYQIPNLLLIEPSTQHAGRQLMERRQDLIKRDYHIGAPCTHQLACPLLVHSKHDWCHDRVHWTPPVWWKKLESFLPMKNQTMTFSYLAASQSSTSINATGRVVGDELKEKGKSRWLFCRGEEREFLSWLNKTGEAPQIHRGELLNVDVSEKKGNELRFKLL